MSEWPGQPNGTVDVVREGDTIRITHMSRLGSRHVIPLSLESARMLAEALFEECRPRALPQAKGRDAAPV